MRATYPTCWENLASGTPPCPKLIADRIRTETTADGNRAEVHPPEEVGHVMSNYGQVHFRPVKAANKLTS